MQRWVKLPDGRFIDANSNGKWDDGELMLDVDTSNGTFLDQVLGYRDGFIDKKDQYAKIQGGLKFMVTQGQWESAQGSTADRLRGLPTAIYKALVAAGFGQGESKRYEALLPEAIHDHVAAGDDQIRVFQ